VNEADFYRTISRNLKPLGYLFQRIETSTQSGVFDTVVMKKPYTAWVEFKIDRGRADQLLRPSQRAWVLQVKPYCQELYVFRLEKDKISVYGAIEEALLFSHELDDWKAFAQKWPRAFR